MNVDKAINKMFTSLVAGKFPSHTERCEEVQNFIDSCERVPKPNQLDRLATYILKRDATPRKGVKMLKPLDSPFLSDSQYMSRLSNESSPAYLDYAETGGTILIPPTRMNRLKRMNTI